MDAKGDVRNSEEEYFIFQRSKDLIWHFPLLVPYRSILAEKDLYIPENELSLLCEFSISTGAKSSKFEDGIMRRYSVFPNWTATAAAPSFRNATTQTMDITPGASVNPVELFTPLQEQNGGLKNSEDDGLATLKDDLKRLYFQRTFSDVVLRVDIHTFAAHKNILCSRCPVFNEMFLGSCNETEITITDVDAETFDRFLLYIYSETLEDMPWEDVKQLYLTGGKYEVASLKKDCSSFLKSRLTVTNVSEILLFADMHGENDLKEASQIFICAHGEEVFLTDAWKTLIVENPLLCSETMHRHLALITPEIRL